MTPQGLLKNTITVISSQSNSDFKDISHRGSTRRAKIEYGDFRKVSKDILEGKNLDDEISFLDVIIEDKIVARGDDITFNGTVYNVEYSTLIAENTYKIFAIKSTRMASSGQVRVKTR